MSFVGVVSMFRIKPQSPVGEGGRMALADHLRELRARLLRSLLVLTIAVVASFFVYNDLLNLVLDPYNQAIRMLGGAAKAHSQVYVSGIAGGLMLQLKLCLTAAVVVSSPFWLYQIWAFILPGLHANEKKWTRIFVGVAGPLFLLGVAVGYYVLPKGMQFLIGVNPPGLENLNDFNQFFTFTVQMLLVFGVSFEIPLFVVLLNLAGVVSGASLARHRSWIIVCTFIFAAVATPSTDPVSMTLMALPMTILFLVSEFICHRIDKHRKRARAEADSWEDDAASPI